MNIENTLGRFDDTSLGFKTLLEGSIIEIGLSLLDENKPYIAP